MDISELKKVKTIIEYALNDTNTNKNHELIKIICKESTKMLNNIKKYINKQTIKSNTDILLYTKKINKINILKKFKKNIYNY